MSVDRGGGDSRPGKQEYPDQPTGGLVSPPPPLLAPGIPNERPGPCWDCRIEITYRRDLNSGISEGRCPECGVTWLSRPTAFDDEEGE